MEKILVRPTQLRANAQTLRSKAKTINAALTTVEKHIHELDDLKFSGNRATSVRSRFSRAHDQLLNASSLIVAFAKDLEESASLFEKADKGNQVLPINPVKPVQPPIQKPIEKPVVTAPGGKLPSNGDVSIPLRQGDYTDVMGENGHTIKQSGCLITDIAMIARFYGRDVTSVDVNNYLRTHGGYAPGTSNLYWDRAEDFINSVSGVKGDFVNIDAGNVAGSLNSGQPVILHIPGNTADGHWVLATGVNGDGSYTVFDPGTGKERTIVPDQVLGGKQYKTG